MIHLDASKSFCLRILKVVFVTIFVANPARGKSDQFFFAQMLNLFTSSVSISG